VTEKTVTEKTVTEKTVTEKTESAKKTTAKKAAAEKQTPAKKPAPRKRIAWKPAKKSVPKQAPAVKKQFVATRKLPAAFMKPLQPNAILGAIIGDEALPITEVTEKIWDYIQENNRQDAQNKVMINADEKLKEVFGGKKQVTMFEMTKLVKSHLKKA
jgi:chromatin remodeling complex protein RSC6